jgi:hypothetical protein
MISNRDGIGTTDAFDTEISFDPAVQDFPFRGFHGVPASGGFYDNTFFQ